MFQEKMYNTCDTFINHTQGDLSSYCFSGLESDLYIIDNKLDENDAATNFEYLLLL